MLIGEYIHTIDPKKRLAIPAKLRKEIGVEAIITRGLDNCLFLYPARDWQLLVEKINQLPISQQNARSFSRLMLAGATDANPDTLGRVLIPDYLKTYADLKKRCVIIGVYNRLEIWDEEKWNIYKSSAEKNTTDIAEKLGELGI